MGGGSKILKNLYDGDVENELLGCCLHDEDRIPVVHSIIKSPRAFYEGKRQILYSVIYKMFTSGRTVNFRTVIHEVKSSNVGIDEGVVRQAYESITGGWRAIPFAKIVRNLFIRREGIIQAEVFKERLKDLGMDVGLDEKISEHIEKLGKMQGFITDDHFFSVHEGWSVVLEEIEKRAALPDDKRGVRIGIPLLDGRVGFLKPSTLTMVLGAPSMGKSDTMINWALEASKNTSALLCSAEMSKDQITVRMISCLHNVDSTPIEEGVKNGVPDEFYEMGFGDRKIYIDDRSSPSVVDIRGIVASHIIQKQIGVVFIDHLQLLSHYGKSEGVLEDTRNKTRAIKAIARDYLIPVILLNQLSREGQKADRPQAYHSRLAGDEDADRMVFLWREHHGEMCEHDRLELIVRKYRSGRLGTVFVEYDLTSGRQNESTLQERVEDPDVTPIIPATPKKEKLPF